MTTKKNKTGAVIKYEVIKANYTTHDVKTGSGKRRAVDNKDKVAGALRGKTEKEWRIIAKENELPLKNWAELNPGLMRLALGNALRRLMRANGKITVLGATVKA